MEYAEWDPGPDLRPHIRCIWSLRHHASGSAPEPILPDASPEIIFNFGDRFRHHHRDGTVTEQPNWFVVGQIDSAMLLEAPASADVVGVRLRPTALPALFGLPAPHLTRRVVAIRDLLPVTDDAWDLAAETRTLSRRVDAVRDFVRSRLRAVPARPDPLVHEVLWRVETSGGASRLRDVARDVGRSPRVLERRVFQMVGLRPKMVARIVRIQRVLALKRSASRTTWAALAYHCGFADQAHLVRDFRRIAGKTPTAFFGETTMMNDAFLDRSTAAFVQATPGTPS